MALHKIHQSNFPTDCVSAILLSAVRPNTIESLALFYVISYYFYDISMCMSVFVVVVVGVAIFGLVQDAQLRIRI